MTIFLDNEPLVLPDVSGDATVAEVVEAAKNKLAAAGSVIVGVRCDSKEVSADQLGDVLGHVANAYERLELLSASPRQTVLNAIGVIRGGFTETIAAAQAAAESISAGKVQEAMEVLAQCATVWARAHSVIVQGGSLLGVRFDELSISNRPIIAWLTEIAEKLRELKGAIESRDTVLLADILRYEMDETLGRWEQMLDGFAAHVEQMPHASLRRA